MNKTTLPALTIEIYTGIKNEKSELIPKSKLLGVVKKKDILCLSLSKKKSCGRK